MRRGIKFSKKAYIILGITALFNLLSIVFDQLVVQQEDKIRIFDKEMNNQKIEVNSILYAHSGIKFVCGLFVNISLPSSINPFPSLS